MIHLKLRRSIPESCSLDLRGIVPTALEGLDVEEIQGKEIGVDGCPQPLGGWFDVEVDGPTHDDEKPRPLIFHGNLSRCRRVAGNMHGGQLTIDGDVGDSLAENMRSGMVHVKGSAGRFAAGRLRGGEVIVQGNVGEYAAGGVGGKHGMRGGTLVVRGNCGRWLGMRLRRGTVVVEGTVAAGCASRMIAGTIVLLSDVTPPLASGMKRGTILFAGKQPACAAPGFNKPEKSELAYLTMLMIEVARFCPGLVENCVAQPEVLRSIGDLADGGLGELIWLTTEEPQASLAGRDRKQS